SRGAPRLAKNRRKTTGAMALASLCPPPAVAIRRKHPAERIGIKSHPVRRGGGRAGVYDPPDGLEWRHRLAVDGEVVAEGHGRRLAQGAQDRLACLTGAPEDTVLGTVDDG